MKKMGCCNWFPADDFRYDAECECAVTVGEKGYIPCRGVFEGRQKHGGQVAVRKR